MATWQKLKDYIVSNYRINQDIGGGLQLTFDLGGGRSQIVFITHYTVEGGSNDWVVVESPLGEFGKVDLARALTLAGEMTCGGIGLFQDDLVTLRDAISLTNMETREFEELLELIMRSADQLEAALTGRDDF